MASALATGVCVMEGGLEITAPDQYHSNSVAHQYSTTRYLNYTGKYISVGDNKGLEVEYRPRPHATLKDFIIREETYYPVHEANSIRDCLIRKEGNFSPSMKLFAEEFFRQYTKSNDGVVMKFDYVITLESLRDNNNSILHKESNKIISLLQDDIPPHPFSRESLALAPRDCGFPSKLETFIVDNLENIPDYRTNLFGESLIIPRIIREGYEDGLYIVFQGDLNNFHEGDKQYEFYPKDELDQCPFIHQDAIKALVHRSVLIATGKEIKEGKAFDLYIRDMRAYQENLRREQEEERKRMDLEISKLEHQQKRDELDGDRQFAIRELDMKMRHMDQRDLYEGRSTVRKDRSDIIKNVPVVTGAATSLALLAKTLLS